MLAKFFEEARGGSGVGMNFQQAIDAIRKLSLELTHESGEGIHHFLWICDFGTGETVTTTSMPMEVVPEFLRLMIGSLERGKVEQLRNDERVN